MLDAEQLEIEPVESVDPLRPVAHVRANAVEVERRPRAGQPEPRPRACPDVDPAVRRVRSASPGGPPTPPRQYAKIREQFGRPIGQFQAIKHKCAEMIAETERATAAVWDAARAIDEASEGARKTAPSSSPPRSPRRWHRSPHSTAPRTASRCTAASASPGSTTPTSTTAAPSCWPPASAAQPTTRSGWSTSRPPPACARSTSTWTPTPRSCARRSARKSLR